ncbi:thiol:disulfide interchange protein [Lysobacter sp. HA35]
MVLFAAVAFPVLALFIWLITMFRPHSHMPFHIAVWLAAAAGAVGVIATPIYFHRMAKRYGLANWSTFRGVRQRT